MSSRPLARVPESPNDMAETTAKASPAANRGAGFRDTAESNGTSVDTILDFMGGTDRIDLSRIDADTNVAGDQAFRFVGGGAFTGNGTGGELRSTTDAAGRSVVEGDVNGDGVADFTVFVMDATPATPDPLVVSDFIL